MTHPSLKRMLELTGGNQTLSSFSSESYLELCEARKWYKVNYFYDEELKMIYFLAQRTSTSPVDVLIPLLTSHTLDINTLKSWQNRLSADTKSITLIIRDSESTSVFYKITDGLVPPLSPEQTKMEQTGTEKLNKLENEIKHKKCLLYGKAMTNTQAEHSNKNKI